MAIFMPFSIATGQLLPEGTFLPFCPPWSHQGRCHGGPGLVHDHLLQTAVGEMRPVLSSRNMACAALPRLPRPPNICGKILAIWWFIATSLRPHWYDG
jgi:hypothetical protein